MSVAVDESEKIYPPVTYGRSDCYQQIFDSRDVQWAYQNGRMAPVTDKEIEAAAKTRYEGFGPKERKWRDATRETRCRELTMAESMLNAARKAVME